MSTTPSTTDVLKRLLDDRGWMQNELAEALHVDQKTVSRWMTGATNLTERRLRRVFAQLQIDPSPYGLSPVLTVVPEEDDDSNSAPQWAIEMEQRLREDARRQHEETMSELRNIINAVRARR